MNDVFSTKPQRHPGRSYFFLEDMMNASIAIEKEEISY
jgi:hypothetical protein